jgi:bacterioferritin (cytochrome b1)
MTKDNTKETREITDRKDLIELLMDLKAVEMVARDNYEKDIITFKNFIISDTIEKIKKDEDRHIEMLENLIKMLKEGS